MKPEPTKTADKSRKFKARSFRCHAIDNIVVDVLVARKLKNRNRAGLHEMMSKLYQCHLACAKKQGKHVNSTDFLAPVNADAD